MRKRPELTAKLIDYLVERIRWSEEANEREDDASWGDETGILLSRQQAEISLAALRAAVPPAPEEPLTTYSNPKMAEAYREGWRDGRAALRSVGREDTAGPAGEES